MVRDVPDRVLTLRALNRATLARQMLLRREKATPVAAIERLAGLQAQLARPPFVGLWSRIAAFERSALARAVHDRRLVRATWLRATIHLVSAGDYRRLRVAVQRSLDRAIGSVVRDRLGGLDAAAVRAEAARFFGAAPATFDALRKHLGAWRPRVDVWAMSYAVRCSLPLVQVPSKEAAWAYPAASDFALAEPWVGGACATQCDLESIVLSHLAAFGPVTIADTQTWSGISGLKETFEALRPRLRTFRDETGRTLYDVPKAPLPDEDTPAPARFLPEFDGVVLGLADRRRFMADEHKKHMETKNLYVPAVFLVDGRVAGKWAAKRKKDVATIEAKAFGKLAKKAKDELVEEGEALLGFLEPQATKRVVRFG